MSDLDIAAILPSLIVAGGGCLMILFYVLGVLGSFRSFIYYLTLLTALFFSCKQGSFGLSSMAMSDSLFVDPLGSFYSVALVVGAIFCAMMTFGQLEKQEMKASLEFDVLQLFAIAGGLVMITASNLVVLFVGFELLSVCIYVLCGAALTKKSSSESALKYFMMGAFSSAFLLYGMALVYGATGSFAYHEIASRAEIGNPLLLVGIAMILFGFAFKVSLAPFHIWTPDVYQGAPTSVTAFMAVVIKIAAFGAFLRLFSFAFQGVQPIWVDMVWLLAVLSMTVGNLMAIQQKSIKRLLAYSSVAHAGYLLMGFLAFGPEKGAESATYYLIAYSLMTIASFGCVLLVTAGTKLQYERDTLESFSGIGWTRPYIALAMTISMFALAGMPPMIGFLGKFYLFSSAIESSYVGLVIIAALNSVLSLYYYLRVIVVMYFRDASAVDTDQGSNEIPSAPTGNVLVPSLAVSGATIGVVVLGIYSSPLLRVVENAFQ